MHIAVHVDINKIAAILRRIWPPSLIGDTNRLEALVSLYR